MKTNAQITYLAHMLDEALGTPAGVEDTLSEVAPEDEEMPFVFGEVITADAYDYYNGWKGLMTRLWPKWEDYFISRVNKLKELNLYGDQTDVDDWDEYAVKLEDLYHNGIDGLEDAVLSHLDDANAYPNDKIVTLKSIIDNELDNEIERVSSFGAYDKELLKQNGRCVHKGRSRF